MQCPVALPSLLVKQTRGPELNHNHQVPMRVNMVSNVSIQHPTGRVADLYLPHAEKDCVYVYVVLCI